MDGVEVNVEVLFISLVSRGILKCAVQVEKSHNPMSSCRSANCYDEYPEPGLFDFFCGTAERARNLQAKMSYLAANPQGYTPQQLASATTSINENTATAAKQALGSAAAFAASHGGADVGNGAVGEIAGQIGSQAAQSKAQHYHLCRSRTKR